jgi:tRNA threonylcarbamoyladenosine biosynthesis protein TsaB
MKNLILALDCSLRRTNAAVFLGSADGGREGELLASESLDIGRRQATELPVAAERVLAAAGRRFDEVGLVAVTNGPGYFTGLRVGVSYAMGLAYGLKIDVVPVSTLYMLACPRAEAGEPVLALAYAGQGRVYAASFGCDDGDGGKNLPAGEYDLAALESWLSCRACHAGQKTAIVSDDPQKIAQALKLNQELNPEAVQILGLPVLTSHPDAAAAARIAWRTRESAVAPMALRISYLREPQIG